MKSIKCSKCGKTVEVEDSWVYSRCETCRTKDLAYKQVQKEKRRLDREGRNKIKELKLERAMNFSEWSKFAKEVLHNPDPIWEQYLDYLKQRKEHEIYDKAELETYRLKAENRQKYALICPELYPFSHERQCYNFRLTRLNGSENLQHLDLCESCRDWNYAFVNDVLPEPQNERDKSWIQTPRDDSEFSFERPKTIPDHSLDRFRPKQQSETEIIENAFERGNVRVEPLPQPHSEPEQPDPTTSRNDLQNILDAYDQQQKKKEQAETDNQRQESEGD